MEKNITLEQVDLIMQRANVSYSEAKEALEKCNGDVVEALLYLEKSQKIKAAPVSSNDKITAFINKLNATSFILKKSNHTYIDVPLSVAIIAGVLCFPFSLIALALSLITGIKLEINEPEALKEHSGINLDKK